MLFPVLIAGCSAELPALLLAESDEEALSLCG